MRGSKLKMPEISKIIDAGHFKSTCIITYRFLFHTLRDQSLNCTRKQFLEVHHKLSKILQILFFKTHTYQRLDTFFYQIATH